MLIKYFVFVLPCKLSFFSIISSDVWTTRFKSDVKAVSILTAFRPSPANLACWIPVSFNGVSVCPWRTPALFESVSPLQICYVILVTLDTVFNDYFITLTSYNLVILILLTVSQWVELYVSAVIAL